MALAFISSPFTSSHLQPKATLVGSYEPLDRPLLPSTVLIYPRRKSSVKPLNAEPKRSDSVVPLAAIVSAPELIEKVEEEDYENMAKELENASPLEIMDKALEKFGNDIAIAFSGAEDVALIEYAKLTGRPFRVFSLDTGRLNPETYKFFDTVEKHYDIHIEYMFPDAVEVQALFLRAMNVPVNDLHVQGYVSIGCEPCTRPVLPGQHEREGRWWWEDAKAKECGLHKGNIKEENVNGNGVPRVNGTVIPDIFDTDNVVNLSGSGIKNLLKLENRRDSWLVVLYAPWCPFCQAMEGSYVELAEKLAGSGVKVAKFRADGDRKAFVQQELQLGSFPTILFFPKHTALPIKYPSENRDVESLLAYVNALR